MASIFWRPERSLANLEFSLVFGYYSRSTANTVVADFAVDLVGVKNCVRTAIGLE